MADEREKDAGSAPESGQEPTSESSTKSDETLSGDDLQSALKGARSEAANLRVRLRELEAKEAEREKAKQQAETKRLEEQGKYEELAAKMSGELEGRTAQFRTELLKRDLRSAVLEHIAPDHRGKLDLVLPSVQAQLGDVEWDGLALKTDVAKAAKKVIAELGFATPAEEPKKRTTTPPTKKPPETNGQAGKPIPMRDMISHAVEAAWSKP